ncbi:MAG: hypothetical protein ACI4A3_00830, partial [Lachnospiraceae bacterium]
EKISVLFARFRQEKYLLQKQREFYAAYMAEQEEALCSVVRSKKEKAYGYLVVCEKQGVITLENVDWFLEKMEEPCYTESRAYLLHLKKDMRKSDVSKEIWKEWSL